MSQLQRHYEQHLRAERGLAPSTVTNYSEVLRWFLTDRFGDGPLDLRALDVSTITTFVIRHAHTMSPGHPSTVSTIVRRALARAGLSPSLKGAHLLRHSLATRMLRQGASLPEIGLVLRHRAVQTTEIYAKVDLAGLRALAQPWPLMGGAQ
ncbi:MAG: tyrosine-type recombinase/integrase [Acidobacteria bacterium]|nr:tyrosine-type recombinase/integrase [Acidobacteriota bacterium]